MSNNKQKQPDKTTQEQVEKKAKQEQLERVVAALEEVNDETKQMIYNMAIQMGEIEIIRSFNQSAQDLFTFLILVTRKINKEREYGITGYKNLFDNAIKINIRSAIDKFTLIILEFARDIYTENEEYFLGMSIPDANLNVNNEFGLLRSNMFKELWKISNDEDKNKVKDIMMLITTYAHTYLYKTILINRKKIK